eukprot:c28041_g3_i3 orf=546-3113(+)
MAQCHAEEKSHPNRSMELYVGAFNSRLYSANGGKDGIDGFQSWSSYNSVGYSTSVSDASFANVTTFDKIEATMDRMVISGGSFHEEQSKVGAFTKSDTDNGPMEGTQSGNGRCSTGANRSANSAANHNCCLFVGAGKVSASSNGSDLRNATNGAGSVGFSPICSACTPAKDIPDLGPCKPDSAHSLELPKWGTKSSSEASVMVTGSQIGNKSSKVGCEISSAASGGSVGSKGSPGCGSSAVGSLRVGSGGHGDNASSGGSSNGGSPTAESFKGGKASCIGNILGNSGSPNGGVVRSSGTVNNVLGGNVTGTVGNLRRPSTKSSINDGQSPTPAPHRGISTPKTSGEVISNGNGSSRGAPAFKLSGEGSLGGGMITGNRPVRGTKSAAGSPVKGSLTGTQIPIVGNLCRGNVLNGNAKNGGANRCNGKDDNIIGNVLGMGNLCTGISGRGNVNGDVSKNGMESLGSGNSQLTGECLTLKQALASTDAEEVKTAGNEEYKKGHFSEALSLYDRAISLSVGQASYRSNRAAALTGLGRLAEAVQECEEAIKLDPAYVRAHQRAASLYLRLGLVESAKRHLTAAGQHAAAGDIQRIQNVAKHISRCIEARKLGDWKAVIRESDGAIVAGADSAPQIYGYKAEALLKLQRPDEADSVLAAAQRVENSLTKPGVMPADSSLFVIRAHIDMALGRSEGAILAAESAACIDPRNAEISALLRKARAVGHARTVGNELFKAGKFFEACASYGEGLESDPRNAVLLCNRAACRSKLGQWEKAVEDCNAALNVQPNYTKALMRRANCNSKLERWEEALRDYEVLQVEVPGDMEVARGLFDVQVAIKKSRGEEIYKMKFGGEVEEVS